MLNHKNILYRLSPLLLLIFIDSFSFFVVIPVLLKIFYHNHYGLLPATTSTDVRNTLTGITISLSMLAAIIAAPFVGGASDKYGRKKTLLFCIICVAFGFLFPIIGIARKNIYLIFIGRIISGFGSASQPVAQAAVSDVCQQKDKAIYLGSIALMMTLALIFGPLVGGFLSNPHLVSWFGARTPFEFALVLSIINFFLIVFFFKETLPATKTSALFSLRAVITGLPRLIRQYHVGGLIILFFCLELGWSQYYQSISLFLHLQNHFSTDEISVFNANMGIIMAIGLLAGFPLLLRFSSIKTMMQLSIVFVLMGLSACALFPVSPILWIFSSVVAFFTGIAYVSVITLISNNVSTNAQGIAMGYLSTLLYFAWMMTAAISGFLMSWHTTLPLYFSAIFLILSCVGFVRFKSSY